MKILIIFIAATCFYSCVTEADSKEKIMVYAGVGMADAIGAISDSFTNEFGIEVQLNLASSGTLSRQIEQGQIPDVFISASKKWADYIEQLGYIQNGCRTEIIHNELVLIAPVVSSLNHISINETTDFKSFLNNGRLSMGDPAHVPAGNYAKQAIDYYHWDAALKNQILPAKDVRSALKVVELNEAPLGIVYKTDAIRSNKVKIVGTFDECSHQPIRFTGMLISKRQVAKKFYEYLTSDKMKLVWKSFGYSEL